MIKEFDKEANPYGFCCILGGLCASITTSLLYLNNFNRSSYIWAFPLVTVSCLSSLFALDKYERLKTKR